MEILRRFARPVVILLFLCSGASGLIFETLWMRLLTTTFGSTTFAISTLLTVFMGGLALGGWLAGGVADRLTRESSALIIYGGLELAVGAYGLVFPLILEQVQVLHSWIWAQWGPGPYAFALMRFLIVGVVLLLPTTAMGATLPVLARFYARRRSGLGREVGTLYSINILGAVTGTFLAGFVFMPSLGLTATGRTACSINLVLCIASVGLGWWMQRRGEAAEVPATPRGEAAEAPATPRGEAASTARATAPTPDPAVLRGAIEGLPARSAATIALGGVLLAGAIGMVYQQAWTRVLTLVVGSSVYAFALILMAFLLGLALGGGVYARRTAHRPGQLANLGVVHLLVASMVMLGFLYIDRLPLLFVYLSRSTDTNPANIFALKFLVCALVVLLPTFFMGMVFPATIAVCEGSRRGVGRTVGQVYAFNTLGAIVGSFLGGFVLIPWLGTQRTLAAMIVVNLALAVVFTGLTPLTRWQRYARAAVAGLLLLGTLAGSGARWDPTLMTAGVFRLATLDRSLRYGDCPDPDSPLQRHFREGPGRAQVRRAEAVVGYRPELKDPCDPVAGRRLIYYQEGVVATVSTWHAVVDGFEDQSCWEYLSLQVNGKNDASASSAFRREAGLRCADYVGQPWRIEPGRVSMRGDMETQVLSGLLGPLVLPGPRPPRRALVIGWGSGISVGEMARLGDLRVEAVELEPEVLRAAQAFERYNRHASRASNVEIHEADGRNVLLAMREGFDVIVSEPSNPWMTGAASLFTREFFQLIRRRLRPDGVFIQWLQLYEISTENVLSIIATLRSVFPRVTIFRSQHAQVDLLLVASFRPLAMEGARLARRMRAPRMRGALARIQITSLGDLVARYLVSPAEVDRLVRGVPVNTDDNARIEFSAPRDLINYRKHSPARILARLQRGVAPVRQRVVHAPGSLGIELVDAFVKIGDPRRAREVLRALPDTPAKRKRRRMLRWLTNRADVNRLLQAALGRHPGGESLRRILGAEGAISATQRAQAVRALADAPASEQTFRMLGLLLFPTRHQRLSLLFLTASQQLRAAPLPKIERLRVYLLHRFELHDVALQRALDANPPRM